MKKPCQLRASYCLFVLVAIVLVACSRHGNQNSATNVEYWTCAMHPSVHSTFSGKCPICGMELVPIANEQMQSSKPSELIIPDQRQREIGVTYAEVRRRPIRFHVRSVGTLEADPAQTFECVARVQGYVEELWVSSPGERVGDGQPLMMIYSPDLRAPEQELINLLKVHVNGSVPAGSVDPLVDYARHRLERLNISPKEIYELEQTQQPTDTLLLRSPCAGIVSDAPMKVGTGVKPGDKLMTVVNLSRLWLWVNFYENEFGVLKEGQSVTVTLPAFPSLSFEGKIGAVSPMIDPTKRTGMVRIDVPNPDGKLRPGMYANVVAEIDGGEGLAIPVDSVLPTGLQMLVFVEKGSGRLEPRFIQVGRQFVELTDGKQQRYYQITDGLKEGERVVTSANFLIDAEAQVQGRLKNPDRDAAPISGELLKTSASKGQKGQ